MMSAEEGSISSFVEVQRKMEWETPAGVLERVMDH